MDSVYKQANLSIPNDYEINQLYADTEKIYKKAFTKMVIKSAIYAILSAIYILWYIVVILQPRY